MDRIEFRAMVTPLTPTGEGDSPKTIQGYAAKYNVLSEVLTDEAGPFVEILRPGCFDTTLSNGADVRCLINHNEDLILGRTKSGTLELKADDVGLWFSVTLPETQTAKDLTTSVKRGDIDQCSFMFSVTADRFEIQNSGQRVRNVNGVNLYDVSLVTFPAYNPSTFNISLRSLLSAIHNETVKPVEDRNSDIEADADRRILLAKAITRLCE